MCMCVCVCASVCMHVYMHVYACMYVCMCERVCAIGSSTYHILAIYLICSITYLYKEFIVTLI